MAETAATAWTGKEHHVRIPEARPDPGIGKTTGLYHILFCVTDFAFEKMI